MQRGGIAAEMSMETGQSQACSRLVNVNVCRLLCESCGLLEHYVFVQAIPRVCWWRPCCVCLQVAVVEREPQHLVTTLLSRGAKRPAVQLRPHCSSSAARHECMCASDRIGIERPNCTDIAHAAQYRCSWVAQC